MLTLVSGDGHFLSERVVPYLPPPPPTCGDGRDNVLSPATCSPAPGWRRLEEGEECFVWTDSVSQRVGVKELSDITEEMSSSCQSRRA